ncbi:phosphotransferase family protein [Sphingomonas sp.]|uniref:phosphotransferase family protein n=1 Tax=Sphingomonas sp. TaxID=28214 RepID=UPI003CC55B8E
MTLTDDLAAYLGRQWGAAVAVEGLARIPGGASRETWRFDAVVGNARRPLILRRDPGDSLIETERRVEFAALQTAQGRVPAPAPLLLEEGAAALGAPFFVMERIDGGSVASPFSPDPYGAAAATLGAAFFTGLGRLAATPLAGTPLAGAVDAPAPDACWRVQLDHWAGVIDADEQHPQPIVRAAIRRLRAHPPPPPPYVAVVHGDYRSGNVMHNGAGALLAVLDWEMAHGGDPLEDLAWAIDPLWGHDDPERVAGLLPRETALAAWSGASGMAVDARALAWWSLFAAVKGQAIWTSAAKAWVDTGMVDPVLAISGWYTARRHDQIIAAQLEHFAA